MLLLDAPGEWEHLKPATITISEHKGTPDVEVSNSVMSLN